MTVGSALTKPILSRPSRLLAGISRVRLSALVVFCVASLEPPTVWTEDSRGLRLVERVLLNDGAGEDEKEDTPSVEAERYRQQGYLSVPSLRGQMDRAECDGVIE